MGQWKKKKNRSHKGFTLAELLIASAIAGLASVLVCTGLMIATRTEVTVSENTETEMAAYECEHQLRSVLTSAQENGILDGVFYCGKYGCYGRLEDEKGNIEFVPVSVEKSGDVITSYEDTDEDEWVFLYGDKVTYSEVTITAEYSYSDEDRQYSVTMTAYNTNGQGTEKEFTVMPEIEMIGT